jgi:uncharacterized RDD family membrane protein YckC
MWCEAFLPRAEAGVKASLLRRFAADMLDSLLSVLVPAVAFLLASPYRRTPFDDPPSSWAWIAAVAYTVAILMFMRRGLTPGKWLLGERVVDKITGDPVGFWRMLLRSVMKNTVSSFFLGLGYLWAIWDRDAQAWHDKIASTVVIKEERPAPLTPARGLRPGATTP